MVPHPLPEYSTHHVKNIITPVLTNNGNVDQSFINVNYFQSENTRESMSTFVLNDHREGESISFKGRCQQAPKFKEKMKIEEYDELLRLWNISADSGEIKIKIDKLKDGIKTENSCEKLVHYQENKGSSKLSPSSASGNIVSPINIMDDSNVDELEKQTFSQNLLCDDSLFCNDVKFGVVYTCCFCENVFASKHSLAKHKRKHNFCQYCKAKFKSLKALNNHRKNCVHEKCINSHPRVELSNIALSRKIRSFYRVAFSRDKFPCLSNRLRYDIKKELVGSNICHFKDKKNGTEITNLKKYVCSPSSNSFNNVVVKFEPIEYEENTESFCKNSIFHDTVENFIKLEAVDIVEEQLTNVETLPNTIKEEDFLNYPSENSILYSTAMGSDTIISSGKVIDDKNNLEGKIDTRNEIHLSEDESYCRAPRFCRFKSELVEEILPPPETEYKYTYEFVKDDNCETINNRIQGYLSSKENFNNVENSISTIISVQNEIPDINENQLKSVFPKIPCSEDFDQSEEVTKSRSETWNTDSKLVSSEQESIKEHKCSSVETVNTKVNSRSLNPARNPDNHLVSSKILTSSKAHVMNNFGKTSYSQRRKYVRFTNTPNLNLFMF